MWNSGAQVWMCMNIINLINGGSAEYSWRHSRTAGFRQDVLLFLILLFFLYNACSSSIYKSQIRFLYSGVTMYLHTEFRVHKKNKVRSHIPQKQTGRRICILTRARIVSWRSDAAPARAADEYLSPGSYQARHIYFHYWQMTVAHPGCGID